MGLLDDAIREHLELQRRRGADPAEVERAEREALGPVRRNRDASAVADPDDGALTTVSADDEPGDALDHDTDEQLAPAAREAADEGPAPAPPAAAYDQAADDDDDDWSYDDDRTRVAPPPAAAAAPPPLEFADPDDEPFADEPAGGETAGGETTEYDVEEALNAETADEGEDVLEETPEFLQDTPDHDRLWFEQRPPRDFDFDG